MATSYKAALGRVQNLAERGGQADENPLISGLTSFLVDGVGELATDFDPENLDKDLSVTGKLVDQLMPGIISGHKDKQRKRKNELALKQFESEAPLRQLQTAARLEEEMAVYKARHEKDVTDNFESIWANSLFSDNTKNNKDMKEGLKNILKNNPGAWSTFKNRVGTQQDVFSFVDSENIGTSISLGDKFKIGGKQLVFDGASSAQQFAYKKAKFEEVFRDKIKEHIPKQSLESISKLSDKDKLAIYNSKEYKTALAEAVQSTGVKEILQYHSPIISDVKATIDAINKATKDKLAPQYSRRSYLAGKIQELNIKGLTSDANGYHQVAGNLDKTTRQLLRESNAVHSEIMKAKISAEWRTINASKLHNRIAALAVERGINLSKGSKEQRQALAREALRSMANDPEIKKGKIALQQAFNVISVNQKNANQGGKTTPPPTAAAGAVTGTGRRVSPPAHRAKLKKGTS